jgi:hypothetical protein
LGIEVARRACRWSGGKVGGGLGSSRGQAARGEVGILKDRLTVNVWDLKDSPLESGAGVVTDNFVEIEPGGVAG